mgnify:CR=1 FL=1
MKKYQSINIIVVLLFVSIFTAQAQEERNQGIIWSYLHGWEYGIKAGFNIGGTSPLPLPKEIRKIAEGLIAMAVREKDNFEEVTVKAKVARKDAEGKRVKEVVDGKKVTVYDEVDKTIKKDMPSRLHARRQMLKTIKKDMPSRLHARREMLKVLYTVTEVPTAAAGKKKNTKEVDLTAKLFDEIAPKYADRNGGYTRIVKIGQRKGDGALEVLLELV